MVRNTKTSRFVAMVVDAMFDPVLLGMTENTQHINGTSECRLMFYNNR